MTYVHNSKVLSYAQQRCRFEHSVLWRQLFQCRDLPIAVIGLAWRADRLARSSRQRDSDWSRVTDPLFVIGTVQRQL